MKSASRPFVISPELQRRSAPPTVVADGARPSSSHDLTVELLAADAALTYRLRRVAPARRTGEQ